LRARIAAGCSAFSLKGKAGGGGGGARCPNPSGSKTEILFEFDSHAVSGGVKRAVGQDEPVCVRIHKTEICV
jgi:hypothetical protein